MLKRNFPSVITVILLLIIWQSVCSTGLMPSYMLPSPVDVIKAFVSEYPLLFENSLITLQEAFIGLFLGVSVGFFATVLKDVALLDEPFPALDTLTKSSMHKWYLDVMEKIQLSTLFITHDIDEAILISDRIYLLSGTPGEISGEIIIREPKPRRADFNLTNEFLEYKKKILSLL